MDPIDNDWLGNCKSEPVNDNNNNGNVARSWQWRELGMNPPSGPGNQTVFENIAEDRLVHKGSLNIRCCDLPGYPRSTFLMVFSPDGTKVASTHGNHNIYVSELASGKHVRVLKGHPRTPWCIAFHPSHAQLIGSGCLGGQVRVWDLSGGSETWTVSSETVIASIAFHPRDQLLVIATYNELYFWDWSQPIPFTKVCTNNVNEKVRFVAFDGLGHKLITGITVWPTSTGAASLLQTAPPGGSPNVNSGSPRGPGGPGAPDPPANPSSGNRQQEEMIVTSYNNLVQRYDSLVRNYHRLFLARTQGTSTTDRGTDPMEVDGSNSLHQSPGARYTWALRSGGPRPSTSRSPLVNGNPLIGGGSRDNIETSDTEANPSSRSLSLDVLSLDNNASAELPTNAPQDSPTGSEPFSSRPQLDGHVIFGSRQSAFQPLSDHSTDRTFAYASTDPQRRLFRRLPNPFSSTSNAASQADLRQRIRNSSSSSRTRLFQSLRNLDMLTDDELSRRIDQRLNRLFVLSSAPPDNLHSQRPSTLERVLQIGLVPSEVPDHNRSNESRRGELRRSMTRILRPQTTHGGTDSNTREPVLGSTIPGLDTQNRSPRAQNEQSRAPNNTPRAQNDAPRAQIHRARNGTTGAQSDFARYPRHDPIPNMRQRLQTLQELVQSIPTLHDLPPRPQAPSPPHDPIGELFIDHGDHLELPDRPNDGSRSPPFRGFSSSELNNASESSGTTNTDSRDSNTQRSADASQTITRSLDIIRDILRDSGTRLLNLITDMSYTSLANVEDGNTRISDRTNSEDGESRTSSDRRGNLLSSDSDSDHSLEVNIYRTRNATFPENRPANTSESNAESDRPQRPTNRMVVNLDIGEGETGEHTLNNNRINITVSNNRFRLRTNIGDSGENARPQLAESRHDTPSTSATERPQNVPADLNSPSTSRNELDPNSEQTTSSTEALRKVRLGIEALQRHTTTLTNMWLSGNQSSMRDLRIMWEDLRRHIVALHRQSARQETPNYYVRSLLERCQMLTDMSRRSRREQQPGNSAPTADTTMQAGPSTSRESRQRSQSNPPDAEQPSTSYEHSDSARTRHNQSTGRNRRSPTTSARFIWKLRCSPATRRRLQARWRSEDDIRKRHRLVITNIINRYMNRYTSNRTFGRSRRSFRSIDLYFTRYAIHLRSMQVLSVMFNLMMGCLEESELSGHITTMLRALKKSIGVTCLILMTIRAARDRGGQNFRRRNTSASNDAANNETGEGLSGTSQQSNTINMETLQNGHNNDNILLDINSINEERSDTNQILETPSNTEESANNHNNNTNESNTESVNDVNTVPWCADRNEIGAGHVQSNIDGTQMETTRESRVQEPIIETQEPTITSQEPMAQDEEEPTTSHKWSNRLDIQISAANKNLSDTAKRRKALYLERKRQKVLHHVNPKVHPLLKKKNLPPLKTHRIPTSQLMPPRTASTCLLSSSGTQCSPNTSNEPIAGPSNAQPSTSTENSTINPTRSQEYRAGLFRFAQFHAARLRNASRNRYRIRLYASVREILQSTNSSGDREPEDPQTINMEDNRRLFSTYHPRLRLRNNLESLVGEEGRRPFDSILNNVAVPLVHVNDLPVNDVQGGGDAPPRVNEYLQPIILAQNALVVEEGGGGGGGGLLEAGLVSELLSGAVSPTHRVQAWDFTNGEVPDIRDGTKNVVVQRCKIHNDASIDISRDGRLLVALLPVHRMRNITHRLGVYSLDWATLGQCLHTAVLDQSAVSVALSPTARHLAVGLGSRRVTTLPQNRNNVFALIFRLAHEGPINENSRHCGLIPVRILDQSWEHSPAFTSLNCLRWAPAPGQALVLANNTGQLVIMS